MLLRALKIENFRQFKGKQSLIFPIKNGKNVTVILGQNTTGKTTLVQAFRWILYGKTSFETADFLLNLEIANSLPAMEVAHVRGELELTHEGIDYTISRQQEYLSYGSGNVRISGTDLSIRKKMPNGQVSFVKARDQMDTINRIMPEELCEYFFFDGERIGNLGKNDPRGRREIANAVKGVLGLDILDSAIAHLSGGDKISVLGKLRNSLDTRGDAQLQAKSKELKQRQGELAALKNSLKAYQDSVEYYRAEIDKKEELIKANAATAALKREMQKNESEIKIKQEKEQKTRQRLVGEFSRNAPMYFMKPLLAKALAIVEDYGAADQGIPEMHADAIDFLVKRGRCICGTDIREGTEVYRNLLAQKSYLPPESIGTIVRLFINNARHFNDIGSSFYSSFLGHYKDLRGVKNEISNLVSRNEDISSKIDGKPDVGQYEVQVREFKRKLDGLLQESQEKIKDQGRLENEIERLEREIERLASNHEKNRFTLQCIEYAQYINDILVAHYRGVESSTRRRLQERINNIFGKMYHGKREIVIDDRYEYSLVTPDLVAEFQSKADESKGLETVTSFAFIAGIVSLAKEKIKREYDEVDPEPYPLVMDAPFSNADDIHVANVSKVLPEVAEQVIMFVMRKDWGHAEQVLRSRVAQIYELDKRSETHTVIRGEINV